MQEISTLALIGGIYFVGVVSPGPNVFIISQLALAGERRRACLVAAGVMTGSLLWALSAMAGFAALFAHASWLSFALRLAGAVYLVWYGFTLLRNAAGHPPPEPAAGSSAARSLRTGVFTSLTNPKSGVFWTSIFATTLPLEAPAWLYAAIVVMVGLVGSAWYFGIALLLAAPAAQAGYRRLRRPIEAVCGTILVLLGARLAVSRA